MERISQRSKCPDVTDRVDRRDATEAEPVRHALIVGAAARLLAMSSRRHPECCCENFKSFEQVCAK